MTGSPDGDDRIRSQVRERYGSIASSSTGCCGAETGGAGCCGAEGSGCCSTASDSTTVGYRAEELAMLPEGADLGLGCGNPTGLLELHAGEVVLDLGSGAGVDCFLAARKVGPTGRVIGVDMTPKMLERARANAARGGFDRVEFRLGEIEHLPVADATVDVVLSNCVINLAPEKGPVYAEAFRVLRPGGRLAVADVAATREIPESLRNDPARWSSCSSGAIGIGEMEQLLSKAGFQQVSIRRPDGTAVAEGLAAQDALGVVAVQVRAVKPGKVE